MGMIESEFLTNHFENLVQVIVSSGAIPAPTFPVLGADRLVASLSFSSLAIVAPQAGLTPPPGVVLARAVLKIGHASIAELTTNAAAMSFTDATAWLFVGVSAAPHRLTADLARIDIPGRPLAPFTPPLRLAKQPDPIELPGAVASRGQAILVADDVCTVRFVTSDGDDLFAPCANRVKAASEGWAIHVSGQVIVEQLLAQLTEAKKKLPADVDIETEPYASWSPGFVGLTDVAWGAFGGFGVEKVNACADVDVSIDITANVILTANREAETLTTRLTIKSDASDWDSFRCWVAKGGLLAAVFLPPLGIVSLVGAGMLIGRKAGEAAADGGPGGDWKVVASSESSTTYEMVSKLPKQGPTSNIGSDPTIDDAGLLISGDINPIPSAVHVQPHFDPDGGVIDGTWVGGFDCKNNNWSQSFELPYVTTIDAALVATTAFARLPVKIFATSTALPANLWSLEVVTGGFDESVKIVCHASAADHPAVSPLLAPPPALHPTPSGFAFIHTSAGLKRFDLGPIPASKTPPDEVQLIPMRVNCRNFGREWLDPRVVAKWLVDPPEIGFGHIALRQWQLTLSDVPQGATILVHAMRDGQVTPLASVTASRTGQLAIEVVTDGDTDLAIDHTLRHAPAGARLSQRWLLPTSVTKFDGTATGVVRIGDEVHVVGADRLLSVSTLTGQVERPGRLAAAAPFSLTLPDGKVAAIHDNSLVIAIPHGGAAARSLKRSEQAAPGYETVVQGAGSDVNTTARFRS